MSGHVLGYARGDQRRSAASKLLRFGKISDVRGVNDEEQKPGNDRDPYQKPSNMNRDTLSPRTDSPLQEVHVASSTPPMARFTRFRISGILYALNCKGTAPCTASFPAISPVAAFAGLPRTACSTAFNRRGRAAAPFTAIRMRSMLLPETTIAEATFKRGKSHTFRSRTFSK